MSRSAVVLGMHRSGTSAVANAVRLLGFSLGDPADLTPPRPANPEGNREHLRLTRCNERILEAHGGSWHTPPPLPTGWERRASAQSLLSDLRSEFDDIYPDPGWIWKDPRACLTLPLWLEAWDSEPVVVMVFRHPMAVARSLDARNGFSARRSLTLWQTYNESALRNARGLPCLSFNYDEILADPDRFATELRDGLVDRGAAPHDSAPSAASAVKERLRRNSAGEGELAGLSASQLRLWARLDQACRRMAKASPT